MSYRTYINNTQVFGNNEIYDEWLNFVESQGIEVSEECTYDGEITDVMGAVKVIEKIILRLASEHNEPVVTLKVATAIAKNETISSEKKVEELKEHSFNQNRMYDFTRQYENILRDEQDKYGMSLTDHMMFVKNNSYMFMSVAFLEACKDLIEPVRNEETKTRLYNYKLKDGMKIHIHAG